MSCRYYDMKLTFCFSPKLQNNILSCSPNLIWLAAESGNTEAFKLLLKVFKPITVEEITKAMTQLPGGPSVIQIALSKGYFDILKIASEHEILIDQRPHRLISR